MAPIMAPIKERLALLGVSVTTVLLLVMAWVGPAFADGDGGSDGGSGMEILVPLVIVAAVAIPAYLYWRGRRAERR